MKMRLLIAVLFMCSLTAVYADMTDSLAEADRLDDSEEYAKEEAVLQSLLKDAATPAEKAEVLWRLSRVTLNLGDMADDAKEAKDKILKIFEKGEAYADQAIALDANQYMALYWKASNIGKWGTAKGILDALGKAKPMRDTLAKVVALREDFSDSFYVLGQLYEKVPGFPISFGNPDTAVSYGRLSIQLVEKEIASGERKKPAFDHYIQLASHLIVRNWDAAKRIKEQKIKASKYGTTKNAIDKGAFHEGVVTIPDMSDKQEAAALLEKVIRNLESLPVRMKSQEKDLEGAKDLQKKVR